MTVRKENKGECFVAEKTTFNYLHDFLRTEFYRGLAIGNAPRRCHNCGKISVDGWNAAVAQAMQILEQPERGEITDDEMKERFRKL